jgi:SYF2 splicing factor
MSDAAKTPISERVKEVRARLAKARDDNMRAVEQDDRLIGPLDVTANPPDAPGVGVRKRPRGRMGEIEREKNGGEAYTKSMRKRIARMRRQDSDASEPKVLTLQTEDGADSVPIAYGGEGKLKKGAADRVAKELDDMEKRKVLYRKEDAFDEDKADIGFINDPNRRFNKIIDKHYDKYESVRDIKDSLERGTALP